MTYKIVQSGFIYDSLKNVPSCHSAALVEFPDGNIMAAWFGGVEEAHPDASHYKTILVKGQSTFQKPELFWDVPGKSAGNPRLFCDKDRRTWALLPINDGKWCSGGTRTYYCISEDNGKNWSTPVHVPVLDMLLGKNKPLQMPNGKILIPVTSEAAQTSFAVILDPDKKSWDISEEISIDKDARCIQPAFVLLSDGRVMGLLRTNIGNLWQIYSQDGGYTWSRPKKTELPNNNSGFDMTVLNTGEIILVYNDTANEKKRTPLTVATSYDDGESWMDKFVLESDEGEFSYPAVIQNSDLSIHVIYTYLKGPRNTSGRNGTHIKHVRLVK